MAENKKKNKILDENILFDSPPSPAVLEVLYFNYLRKLRTQAWKTPDTPENFPRVSKAQTIETLSLAAETTLTQGVKPASDIIVDLGVKLGDWFVEAVSHIFIENQLEPQKQQSTA
ncbi:hypothetical protein STSP2_00609 [Anaerohalosphaera lusitana]|uniref:Uncharacterized protein n=1 Tax=Anaerohalosphaera lusitana TaxID=1936003 RepID=A0A1U9NHQ0_9BACT|nr:hypothetical protein [Anaerohalosphaera lusitana]AQT67462.1 hypothetical protein STSP2_00609 [Anaerohalosphaera lusitana]